MFLGKFGLSLDNFQATPNPAGGYSINFNKKWELLLTHKPATIFRHTCPHSSHIHMHIPSHSLRKTYIFFLRISSPTCSAQFCLMQAPSLIQYCYLSGLISARIADWLKPETRPSVLANQLDCRRCSRHSCWLPFLAWPSYYSCSVFEHETMTCLLCCFFSRLPTWAHILWLATICSMSKTPYYPRICVLWISIAIGCVWCISIILLENGQRVSTITHAQWIVTVLIGCLHHY